MSLAKKVLSVGIASIMAMSAMAVGTTALADPINTIQTADTISLNDSKTVTLKYGDIGNFDTISEDTVYYKFTAPSTDYYEFTLTGYRLRADNNVPSAYIDVSDEFGIQPPSNGGSYNQYFNDVKMISYLEQGKTYIIDIFYSPFGSQEYNDNFYCETPIALTASKHTHDFAKVLNVDDTEYTCKRCNYSYLELHPTDHTPTPSVTEPSTTPTQPAPAPTSTVTPTTANKVSKPKKTKIKKVKAAKKALTVTWNKVSGVKGYQVQVATDKKFKNNKKTVTIKKQKNTKTTVKKLKAKKKYYVRVRTYKTVKGKKVYSSWSSVKKTKTK